MSTFHPAASLLTIQYRRSLWCDSYSTLAVLIKKRTNVCHGITVHIFWGVHGEHQVSTENLHQRVKTQCSGSSKISTFRPAASSLANYNGTISTTSITRLFIMLHMLPNRRRGPVSGVWSILPPLLSAYWVISTYFLAVLEISVCAY